METIQILKELTVTETPLLLFDCELITGATERWSTHAVEFEGNAYQPRVIGHNLFEIRGSSDDGIDGISRAALSLANADSHFSQIDEQRDGRPPNSRFDFFFST